MQVPLCLVFILSLSLAVAVPLLSTPSTAPAGPVTVSPWTLETVGLFGGSAPPRIVLDSAGSPHILYCPPGDVRYASRIAGNWTSEHLVSTPFGGGCTDLVMGSDDIPQVTTPVAIGYGYELYGARQNGTWEFSRFPGGVMDAVDSAGRPHVVTYWTISATQYDLRHLWRDANGTWEYETVEGNALNAYPDFRWYSMVVDSKDEPRILYYDSVRGDVRYASRNASGWQVEVVEDIGNIATDGRQGSLALDPLGTPHIAYFVRTDDPYGEVRYGVRGPSGWTAEVVSGNQSFAPSLAIGPNGVPQLAFQRLTWIDRTRTIYDMDQLYATRASGAWSEEMVLHGHWDNTVPRGQVPQFPALVSDSCGNPHLAFYLAWWEGLNGTRSGAYYATKGEPCQGSARNVFLRIEPRTLNLKSNGQWVSARITVENATTSDLDTASLALNGVPAIRVDLLNNTTILAKFDRASFQATVRVGDDVKVVLTGSWTNGTPFTATDVIRVIDPGGGHGKP